MQVKNKHYWALYYGVDENLPDDIFIEKINEINALIEQSIKEMNGGSSNMSVIKSNRSESEMEFIHTARQLQIYSIQKCVGFPKRYTFYVSQPIADMATKIHDYVKCANSVYPLSQHEAQIRRGYLLRANALLNSLVSQLEVAAELFGIEPDTMQYWMQIVEKEIRLVKAVLKKDKERYKDLP